MTGQQFAALLQMELQLTGHDSTALENIAPAAELLQRAAHKFDALLGMVLENCAADAARSSNSLHICPT